MRAVNGWAFDKFGEIDERCVGPAEDSASLALLVEGKPGDRENNVQVPSA